MRLFASNSNKGGALDIIPENMLLEITDIKLREDSNNIYYAKVRDYKRQFVGWVSLSSLHYELLVGLDYKNDTKYMTYTNSDGTYTRYDAKGNMYNF